MNNDAAMRSQAVKAMGAAQLLVNDTKQIRERTHLIRQALLLAVPSGGDLLNYLETPDGRKIGQDLHVVRTWIERIASEAQNSIKWGIEQRGGALSSEELRSVSDDVSVASTHLQWMQTELMRISHRFPESQAANDILQYVLNARQGLNDAHNSCLIRSR